MGDVHQRCDDAGRAGWRRAVRCDVGRLAKAERTSSGGVRVPGAIVRAGVLTYQRADGSTVRELVPLEEVGREESLRTLRDAPVTVGHPQPDGTGSQLVTPETYRQLAVGHVSGDARVDGEHALADLVVLDAAAIRAIDAGELVELSPGYECVIDPTPGVWQGERYDQVQRERRYNHVALLPEGAGRGGQSVALRVDGSTVDFAVQMRGINRERVDAMSLTAEDVLKRWQQRLDEQEKKLDEEKAKLDEERAKMDQEAEKADADVEAMKAELEAAKAKVAELEAKLAEMEDPEQLDARADARAQLLAIGRSTLGETWKAKRADGKTMTDREIRLAILARACPEEDFSKAPDALLTGVVKGLAMQSRGDSVDPISAARGNAFAPPPAAPAVAMPRLDDKWRRGPRG